jgi:hypothetical protein
MEQQKREVDRRKAEMERKDAERRAWLEQKNQ